VANKFSSAFLGPDHEKRLAGVFAANVSIGIDIDIGNGNGIGKAKEKELMKNHFISIHFT